MGDFLSFLTIRTVLIFSSTAFSLLVVMLALNIITVDEVILMLKLSPDAANAFRAVVSRIQEVTGNILDIISQLLQKLLGWTGVNVDLHKIKIDVNQVHDAASAVSPSSAHQPIAAPSAPIEAPQPTAPVHAPLYPTAPQNR